MTLCDKRHPHTRLQFVVSGVLTLSRYTSGTLTPPQTYNTTKPSPPPTTNTDTHHRHTPPRTPTWRVAISPCPITPYRYHPWHGTAALGGGSGLCICFLLFVHSSVIGGELPPPLSCPLALFGGDTSCIIFFFFANPKIKILQSCILNKLFGKFAFFWFFGIFLTPQFLLHSSLHIKVLFDGISRHFSTLHIPLFMEQFLQFKFSDSFF